MSIEAKMFRDILDPIGGFKSHDLAVFAFQFWFQQTTSKHSTALDSGKVQSALFKSTVANGEI